MRGRILHIELDYDGTLFGARREIHHDHFSDQVADLQPQARPRDGQQPQAQDEHQQPEALPGRLNGP